MGAAVCAFGCNEESILLGFDATGWDCMYVALG